MRFDQISFLAGIQNTATATVAALFKRSFAHDRGGGSSVNLLSLVSSTILIIALNMQCLYRTVEPLLHH